MNKKIAVIGLGYVGLPLAATFSEKYVVLGYDNDAARVGDSTTDMIGLANLLRPI